MLRTRAPFSDDTLDAAHASSSLVNVDLDGHQPMHEYQSSDKQKRATTTPPPLPIMSDIGFLNSRRHAIMSMTLFVLSLMGWSVILAHNSGMLERIGFFEEIYSPLTDATPLERVRFTQAFGQAQQQTSRFAAYPPDRAVDELWDRYGDNPLLDMRRGAMGVPVDQISIAGYPYKATADGARAWTEGLVATRDRYGVDKYMVTTEMFFGMHCLNSVRKALDPGRYPEYSIERTRNAVHIRACVEHIREVIMCTGRSRGTDLITYHWTNNSNQPVPYVNGIHQCQDPEKVLQWALERSVVFGKDGVERPRPKLDRDEK